MKKTLLILLLLSQTTLGQETIDSTIKIGKIQPLFITPNPFILPISKKSVRGSYPIEISFQKTTHIIFPSKIRDFDAGSDVVIATIPQTVLNVLRVKANVKGFQEETNMSVMTEDGGFYSFLVKYKDNPDVFNINISNNLTIDAKMTDSLGIGKTANSSVNSYVLDTEEHPENELTFNASRTLKQKRYIKHIGAKKFDISCMLKGIYLEKKVLYMQLGFNNDSELPFEIDFIKVFIRDKNVLKRMAVQEQEIKPLMEYPETDKFVGSGANLIKVVAIPFYTLIDGKVMEIEVYEKSGGRHLKFQLENDTLLLTKNL